MTDQFELVEETSEFSALDNVIRGKQGPPGIDGKSAYQVAVEEGFEGTEAEWLESLQGDTGKSAYEAAVDGGFTGTEAEFNAELADFNLAVDGAEAAAEAAENAQAAAETAVSHYPTIIDKNWYVWDATAGRYVDTHVVAEGLNGPQGETGPQGPKGDPGEVTQAEFDALSDDVDDLGDVVTSEIAARETVDAAIESGLAIIADGNTHAAIASGQYVYIKGHGTLAEGLYKATAAIPLNGTLSSTNVAVVGGVLNDLSTVEQIPVTVSSTDPRFKSTTSTATCYRCGRIVILDIASRWDFSENPYEPGTSGQVIMTVSGAPTTFATMRSIAFAGTRLFIGWLEANGNITVRNFYSEAYSNSNGPISISFFYLCS